MDNPQTQELGPKSSAEAQVNGTIDAAVAKPDAPGGQSSAPLVPEGPPVAQTEAKLDAQNNSAEQETGKVSPTADNTGIEQSKQQTHKEASPSKLGGGDLSSSSSSDDDEPNDFRKAVPKVAGPQAEATGAQVVPNGQAVPQEDVVASGSAQPQQLNQGPPAPATSTDAAQNKDGELKDGAQVNEAAVAAPQPDAQAGGANAANQLAKDHSSELKADDSQKIANTQKQEDQVDNAAALSGVAPSGTNPEPTGEALPGAQPPASHEKEDTVMKNEGEPLQEVKQSANGGPESQIVPAKQAENQPNPVQEVGKNELDAHTKQEAVSKPISQSQLLWVRGVAKRDDADMEEEEEEDERIEDGQSSGSGEHIDPELKRKCLAAQDPDKLFTLNINTYKVCQLNTLLSALGLRLEPKEQVLTAIRRREHEEAQKQRIIQKYQRQKERDERNRRLKQSKMQEKLEKQKTIDKMRQQREFPNHGALAQGAQPGGTMYHNNPAASDDAYGSQPQQYMSASAQDSNGANKQEGGPHQSLVNDPKSMPGHGEQQSDANMKASPTDLQAAHGGVDKPPESAADGSPAGKEQTQQALANAVNGAGGSAATEQKQANGGSDPAHQHEMDLRALSPTPRKSERERPPVCYEKMNNGRRSDSDEDANAAMPDAGQPGQVQGATNAQKHKKPQDSVHSAAKKHSVEDANKRVTDFLTKLCSHEHAGLMNRPLSKHCPLFEQYKHEWNSLAMIDMQYRCRKYLNSKEIINDINKLILTKFSYLNKSGESDDSLKVHAFQKFVDNQVKQMALSNLPLANKPEVKANPNPKHKPSESHQQSTAQKPRVRHDRKKQRKDHPSQQSKPPGDSTTANKDFPMDDGQPTVIPCKQAVKALTGEQLADLKRDIEALKEEQRADIENHVPECITTNAQGTKNIELNSLKKNPEVAARLVQYVKEQTKKNQRRRRDEERRKKRQQEKANNAAKGPDGQFANAADGTKQAAGAHPAAAVMPGVQPQPGQDLMPAMAQLPPGGPAAFNPKPGFIPGALPMTSVPAAQQNFIQQMVMNGFLGQNGMNPAAFQSLNAMFQMQQQQAANGGPLAALQKQQAGAQGQVAGVQPQQVAELAQSSQMTTAQKKIAAKPAAQDDGSSAQSSSSDSESG